MQYFLGNGPLGARNVTKVISNVVTGLLQNASRRFTYVEQAFFQVRRGRRSYVLPGAQGERIRITRGA